MPKVEVSVHEAYESYLNLIILITSVDEKGKPNVMTGAWGVQFSLNPPLFGIFISPKSYSYELITKTKEFVVNVPTKDIEEKVMFCGGCSGRTVDKFEETGLTLVPAKEVKAPWIKECIIHLECRLIETNATITLETSLLNFPASLSTIETRGEIRVLKQSSMPFR